MCVVANPAAPRSPSGIAPDRNLGQRTRHPPLPARAGSRVAMQEANPVASAPLHGPARIARRSGGHGWGVNGTQALDPVVAEVGYRPFVIVQH